MGQRKDLRQLFDHDAFEEPEQLAEGEEYKIDLYKDNPIAQRVMRVLYDMSVNQGKKHVSFETTDIVEAHNDTYRYVPLTITKTSAYNTLRELKTNGEVHELPWNGDKPKSRNDQLWTVKAPKILYQLLNDDSAYPAGGRLSASPFADTDSSDNDNEIARTAVHGAEPDSRNNARTSTVTGSPFDDTDSSDDEDETNKRISEIAANDNQRIKPISNKASKKKFEKQRRTAKKHRRKRSLEKL